MKHINRQHGFTLLELMTVIAIIAILGAIAVVGYQKYTARAQGADIIEKYDAIRTGVAAKALASKADDCAALVSALGNSNLSSDYATLAYGVEATTGGYRPVLTVCAQADPAKPMNVKVAREAYEVMARNGMVENGAVLTDSVVSFALRLTDGDTALCKTAPASAAVTCGQSQPVAQAPAQPAQPVYPGPTSCPAGQDRLLGEDRNYQKSWACFDACPSGQARKPGMLTCEPAQAPAQPAQPACPAGQQMMTLNVGGSWQRGCQPVCARGQQLNPATKQCDVDHGVTPQATTTAGQAQLPAAVRQQVQAAEQKLSQTLASVATLDEAISQTMAAAQGLPPEALTQSIPGNSALGKSVQVNCKLPEFPDGACKDQVMGNFCTTTGATNAGNCNIAVMCPKTLGVCQGVTPEMRRAFDASMQRIANDWFAQHPGCTTFNQQGC